MQTFISEHVVIILVFLTVLNLISLSGKTIWDGYRENKKKKQMENSLQASEQRIAELLKNLDDNRAAFAEHVKKIRSLAKE